MITEKFKDLIAYIAACNGTGQQELDQKVVSGLISKSDATLVFYYANIKKLHDKLDNIAHKAAKPV